MNSKPEVTSIRTYLRWFKPWLLTAGFFFLFFHLCRWIALFYYGPWEQILFQQKMDLLKGFSVSLRFDLVSVCYALVIPWLLFLIWMIFPRTKTAKIISVFERVYFVFIVTLYLTISGIDLGYYSYFQDHINVLIFGFFEDDTQALINTFIKNYPVALIMTASALALAGLIWLSGQMFRVDRFQKSKSHWNLKIAGSLFVSFVLIAVGARGSLGLFPLHEIDAAATKDHFVNYMAYSGIHGLHRAIKVKSLNTSAWNTNGQFYGYNRWEDAAKDLWNLKDSDLPNDPLKLIQQTTAKNPWAEKTKPHVVVILMESWGGYWMNFNSPTFNVLGDMKTHFEQDFTFQNFLPSMSATIGSLTALMVNSPHRPDGNFLSESRYMKVPFRFSPAPLYKKNGYRTRFVYGGGVGWRSIDRYARVQGFDIVEGDAVIEESLGRKIERQDWGIFDGDLFSYVHKVLSEAKQPEMIFVLTTSNHPPYQVPSDFKGPQLTPPPELQKEFLSDNSIVLPRFQAFRYANQALADFMSQLKSGPLKDKTLVAASGDHGFLLVNFAKRDLLQKWQVPFYLYVPEAGIPKNTEKAKLVKRFGSHMDIFPTLFELSLSQAEHFSFGHSLWKDTAPQHAFHFSRLALGPEGAVLAEKNPEYFKWSSTDPLKLEPTEPDAQLQILHRRYKSMMGLLDYFYEFELEHSKRENPNYANSGG